jgi:hypothetical protein
MLSIKLSFSEAKSLNERVTNDCIAQSKWTDGITNNYCNPYFDEESQLWIVPILEGYENFFTNEELEQAWKN